MQSVVYVSTAVTAFSDAQLQALLTTSRSNNSALGLTGLLVYKDGQFMQALEGPDGAVRERLAVIAADRRHGGVTPVLERTIARREFADWTMGFRSVTDADLRDIPGFDDVFGTSRSGIGRWGTVSRARWLLDWFRDH
ncbi:BLUF domain-containing protein [Herbiconiux sp. L3-i23]|uniref:BLUF domain-containing protein n=1 Tax=Herbiconiux sp. L3-i23 TaxID=2905871 RepID=UPI00206A6793|nr:BLUF domain-containing protein [Herbiconiux sp. L3-i23]BDI24161.1 hypothetical protein L3i23_29370 [Herbiconiux sp. L3-i23]